VPGGGGRGVFVSLRVLGYPGVVVAPSGPPMAPLSFRTWVMLYVTRRGHSYTLILLYALGYGDLAPDEPPGHPLAFQATRGRVA
jgi:hypothetical protein